MAVSDNCRELLHRLTLPIAAANFLQVGDHTGGVDFLRIDDQISADHGNELRTGETC